MIVLNMKKVSFSFLLALIGLFITSTFVFAAINSSYAIFAEEYLDRVCSKRRATGANSVLCYLSDRINSLEEQISDDNNDEQEPIIGAMPDANSPQLGVITFSGNAEEYHFWFTPNANLLEYIAGHTYHVVYKSAVIDTSEWCGQTIVVDRPPYNLFGNVGEMVYYQIIDVTTNDTPCF